MVKPTRESPAERSARLSRTDNDGRPDRIADLKTSLDRIVASGPYPKENPCPSRPA